MSTKAAIFIKVGKTMDLSRENFACYKDGEVELDITPDDLKEDDYIKYGIGDWTIYYKGVNKIGDKLVLKSITGINPSLLDRKDVMEVVLEWIATH